jgi:hypothetical protein
MLRGSHRVSPPKFAHVPFRRGCVSNSQKRRRYLAERSVELLSPANHDGANGSDKVSWFDQAGGMYTVFEGQV